MWYGRQDMASRVIAAARCSMPTPSASRRCSQACVKYRDDLRTHALGTRAAARRIGARGPSIAEWEVRITVCNGGAVMNVRRPDRDRRAHPRGGVLPATEPDEDWKPFEDAAGKYFKAGKRPTIPETIAYYRERKIGLVMFTVDSESDRREAHSQRGSRRCRAREQRHDDGVREHRSAQGQDGRARGAEADRGRVHPRLQVPSDVPGILSRTTAWPIRCTKSLPSTSCRRSFTAAIRASAPACRAAADCG